MKVDSRVDLAHHRVDSAPIRVHPVLRFSAIVYCAQRNYGKETLYGLRIYTNRPIHDDPGRFHYKSK